MQARTTENKKNLRIASLPLAFAALLLTAIGYFVKGQELKQDCFFLARAMALGLVICFGFYLVLPGWFKSRWKQPQ